MAVLVAASEYRCVHVDNLDGGHHEGHFAVPASVYDHAASDPHRSALGDAARAVIGAAHFAGIDVTPQRPPPEQGWEEALSRRLLNEQAANADPAPLPGPTDAEQS